jgi:hypothetical protein
MKKLIAIVITLLLCTHTVFAGTTFGKFNIGVSTGSDTANQLECATFTAPEDGTITNLSQYQITAGQTATQWKGVIGTLSVTTLTLLTNGISTASAVGSDSWATTTFAVPPSVNSGTSYALCFIYNGNQSWKFDNDVGSSDVFKSVDSFASPVGGGTDGVTPSSFISSIYATYVPEASIAQTAFRFRNDDGSEAGATWLAAENTSITQPILTNTRLRIQISSDADPNAKNYQLEYKLATDNWWTEATTTANEFVAPTHITDGGLTPGTGALSVPFYAGYQDGDLAIMCAESANQAISAPSGWTEVTNSPQSYGSAGAQNAVRLAAFYKVVSGAQSNVTVADSGDHTTAIIVGFRGVSTTTPFDVTAGSAESASTTALSWPAVTTTVPNDAIFQCVGLDDDVTSAARISAEANANLTGVIETTDDSTASGAGGGIGSVYGVAPAIGSIGNTTATGVTNNRHAYLTMALKPVIQKILIKTSSNISSAAADATTAQLTPPSGKTTSDFQAGSISDDTNSLPSIDLGSGKYTELEWNLLATTTAATDDVYQFRITKSGGPLNTYSVTPQWTIGTAVAAVTNNPRLSIMRGILLLLGGKLIIR